MMIVMMMMVMSVGSMLMRQKLLTSHFLGVDQSGSYIASDVTDDSRQRHDSEIHF